MKKSVFFSKVFILVIVILCTACSALNLTRAPAGDSGGENPGDAGEVLTCFNAKNYILSFDHTLTVNQESTSLTHILKQGGIALLSEFDSGAHDTLIKTANPQVLNYEYLGVLGPCSVDAQGTVQVSAEGFCEGGVVYLTITEAWGPSQGTMICDDQQTPFTAPGYTATESGPSGKGEEFLITDDPNGFAVMREFLGGEGYHSWTLQMDIDLVPLVPEE